MNRTSADLLSQLSSVGYGLSIFVCPCELALDLQATVTAEVCSAGNSFGPRWPKLKAMKVLISGTERQVQYFKLLHQCTNLPAGAVKAEYRHAGSRKNFDYLSQEGQFFLESQIHKAANADALLLYMQTIDSDFDAMEVDSLSRQRAAAKSKNVRLIGILASNSPGELAQLEDLADEFFIVEKCESDPDQATAFSIDFLGLRGLNGFGIGKVMCKVHFGHDGTVTRSFTPFVAGKLVDRAIRTLHAAGESMSKIGEIVGLDKSNVSRRLSGWQPLKIQATSEWIGSVRSFLEVASEAELEAVARDTTEWSPDDLDIDEEGL